MISKYDFSRDLFYPILLSSLLVAYFFTLLLYVEHLSIGYSEVVKLLENSTIDAKIANLSISIFGKDDFGVRIPFIVISILNLLLFYLLSLKILNKESDALLSLALFMILPGFFTSSLLVTTSSITLFSLLLFLLLYYEKSEDSRDRYSKKRVLSFAMLPIFALLDGSFFLLFLSLFFYSLYRRKNRELIFHLLLFAINMYIFGFDDARGKPKGYFLETIGVMSAIFSPLVFIYFIYSIYRVLIKGKRCVVWFISFTTLALILLLSFRQRTSIEIYAPYLVLFTPLMLKTFLNGLRVRLIEFRKKYKVISFFIISTLILSTLATLFNKPLYHLYAQKEKHFAHKYHIAKELSLKLKELGVDNITFDDEKLLKRVEFYGIKRGDDFYISKRKRANSLEVSIFYTHSLVATFYVTKIPTF